MSEEWKYINAGADMDGFKAKQLERIAVALENLVINQKASMINQALQQENKSTDDGITIIEETTIPKKAMYDWFEVIDNVNNKTRKCNNEGCEFYLLWFDDIKTYKHGKYDPETKRWVYDHDGCKFYKGG